MKNFSLSVKIIVIYLFLFSGGLTKESKYFYEGVELFQNKKFDKSKIFNKNDNEEEEEINLNTVLLLNPHNDEAMYMLALLKIKQSDYDRLR